MAEYIDKSAVIAKIDEFVKLNEEHGFPVDAFDMAVLSNVIMKMPASGVAPVVHGRWECGCQCSVCGDRHGPYNSRHRPYYNYCPNCGAKMDEEAHHGT